ncbi:MAG: P1 family peptidase [Gemmatimonadaceae bacterium]
MREEAQTKRRRGRSSGEVSVDLSPWGLAVGHATDEEGATGLTVVRGTESPFHAAAAVLGRATGTRELHVVSPDHLVDRVDAILLTGGSAYGLDAAAGVMRWMEERQRGWPVTGGVVPIVPAAVIFDLAPLGQFSARPTADMAYAACERARSERVPEGSVGVGTGATVGKVAGRAWAMKGGFGCAVARGGGTNVAAMAVVNALGDVRSADGSIIAGARKPGGGFVDAARLAAAGELVSRIGDVAVPSAAVPREMDGHNTTLAVVAIEPTINRTELAQLAKAAGAALYHRITPTGTSLDGDVVYAVCPLESVGRSTYRPTAPHVEALAVEALELAIERAVRTARGRDGVPGLADEAGVAG